MYVCVSVCMCAVQLADARPVYARSDLVLWLSIGSVLRWLVHEGGRGQRGRRWRRGWERDGGRREEGTEEWRRRGGEGEDTAADEEIEASERGGRLRGEEGGPWGFNEPI